MNDTAAHASTWQGLKWRLEAWRTGHRFQDVALLRSLVYRVEAVFLVHRNTGFPLLHVTAEAAATQDGDLIAGMLSDIQDFARDLLEEGDNGLKEFRIRDLEVWIAPGPHAYLAAVVRGKPPGELRTALQEAIESIHALHGDTLETFFADPSAVDAARPLLESCLRSEYRPIETRRHTRPWLVLAIAAAVLIGGALSALPRYAHWRDFLRRLNSQPGIAVTSAEHNWLRRSRVAGLRDPLAADPAAIAREARLDPDRIHFEWKEYLAIDPVSVLRRLTHRIGHPPEANVTVENGIVQVSGRVPFEWLERLRREGPQVPGVRGVVERDITTTYDPTLALERFKAAFPLPETVTASVENETLVLAGSAPYEWIAPVREGAASIPGITGINGDNLIIDFDPALVIQRFQERFGLPETARASMQHGRLLLSGEAPHAWLRRVRHGALEVPGVRVLDDRNVEDIDQRTFQQAKGAVESTYVYFPPKQDNLTAEASAALSRLPDQIRRCFDAAQRMDVNVVLELRGYADALGREGGNVDLSRRRAEAVRNFLISAGLDGEKINSLGLGAPPPPEPGARPQPEQSSRRVAFRVAIQP